MADGNWWGRAPRLCFAALGTAALFAEPLHRASDPTFSFTNYLSYFTVQSNLAAVIVLLVGGFAAPAAMRWQWCRGATTTAMVCTGVFYAAFLSGTDTGLGHAWVNDVMHRVLPLYLLLDWVLFRPSRPVPGWRWWIVAPVAFAGYTLMRGALVDWYPYGFLDPRVEGYPLLAAVVVGLSLAVAVFATLIWLVGRPRGSASEAPGVVLPPTDSDSHERLSPRLDR